MRRFYSDKETDYRRRVWVIFPLAVVLLVSLLWVTEDVPKEVLELQFGWEGPTRVLPEITLIPGVEAFEESREESRYRATTAVDVEEEKLEAKGEERVVAEKKRKSPQEGPDNIVSPDLDEETVRTYPAHTMVSYSEDYVILDMTRPEYPAEELKHGIEGDVTVELFVNDGGAVENAWVMMATGSSSFEAVSLEAVRRFRFKPPIVHGKPSSMWIRFQIRFRIMN
jgi:TonB family protein